MNIDPPDFDLIRMNSKKYIDSNRHLIAVAQQYAAFHESKLRIQAQLDGAISAEDANVLKNLKMLSCYLDEALEALINNHDRVDLSGLRPVEKTSNLFAGDK